MIRGGTMEVVGEESYDVLANFLKDSLVSVSQEDLLLTIPGWDESCPSPPSEPLAPPAAHALKPSSSSESSMGPRVGVDAFVECVSPLDFETQLSDRSKRDEDSYKEAFESDRSQSPSFVGPSYGHCRRSSSNHQLSVDKVKAAAVHFRLQGKRMRGAIDPCQGAEPGIGFFDTCYETQSAGTVQHALGEMMQPCSLPEEEEEEQEEEEKKKKAETEIPSKKKKPRLKSKQQFPSQKPKQARNRVKKKTPPPCSIDGTDKSPQGFSTPHPNPHLAVENLVPEQHMNKGDCEDGQSPSSAQMHRLLHFTSYKSTSMPALDLPCITDPGVNPRANSLSDGGVVAAVSGSSVEAEKPFPPSVEPQKLKRNGNGNSSKRPINRVKRKMPPPRLIDDTDIKEQLQSKEGCDKPPFTQCPLENIKAENGLDWTVLPPTTKKDKMGVKQTKHRKKPDLVASDMKYGNGGGKSPLLDLHLRTGSIANGNPLADVGEIGQSPSSVLVQRSMHCSGEVIIEKKGTPSAVQVNGGKEMPGSLTELHHSVSKGGKCREEARESLPADQVNKPTGSTVDKPTVTVQELHCKASSDTIVNQWNNRAKDRSTVGMADTKAMKHTIDGSKDKSRSRLVGKKRIVKQKTRKSDPRVFPESLLDVVLFHSGSLPPLDLPNSSNLLLKMALGWSRD